LKITSLSRLLHRYGRIGQKFAYIYFEVEAEGHFDG
jgi:hypothetical protein